MRAKPWSSPYNSNLLENSGESRIAFIVLARSMAKRVLSHHALELFEVFA